MTTGFLSPAEFPRKLGLLPLRNLENIGKTIDLGYSS